MRESQERLADAVEAITAEFSSQLVDDFTAAPPRADEEEERVADGWGEHLEEQVLPTPPGSFHSSEESPYVEDKQTQTAPPNSAPEDDDVSGWVRGTLIALRNRIIRNNLRAPANSYTSVSSREATGGE